MLLHVEEYHAKTGYLQTRQNFSAGVSLHHGMPLQWSCEVLSLSTYMFCGSYWFKQVVITIVAGRKPAET